MKRTKSVLISAIIVIFLLAVVLYAHADTIFSNFGPGDSFCRYASFDVWDKNGEDKDWAMGFTVPADSHYILDKIEMAVVNPCNNNGGNTLMDVFLMDDDAGEPGNVIESFQLNVPTPACPSFVGILPIISFDQPVLDASAQYWLVASAAQTNTQLGWWFDPGCFLSGDGPTLKSLNGGPWQLYNSSSGKSYGKGAFRLTGEALPEVAVDIKPGSCPNPLNLRRNNGVLPVSIMGTAELDVTTIDPETVLLAGVSPVRWNIKDVSTPSEPFTDKTDCHDCNILGPDGYMDLNLKFRRKHIAEVLGNDLESGQCIILDLTGNLKEEFGAVPFIGEDLVITRSRNRNNRKH